MNKKLKTFGKIPYFNKRDFIIEKQIAMHFVQYSKFISNLLLFHAIQITNPLMIQGSDPIMIKGRDYSQS
jgi:hypothetical protein